ncbi:hypothetical protein [Actinoplanes sp. N902-109]|uniref:hypothetical protein n=1 Tax=Actinoplanes sp. (strain N902-109) TaxID=649831 RepID=UPI0003293717|nr:hypothetical protein [Actinoplanes sp. N902-109]AGL19310.1 hypothetical protein L083_5800 [Actinoplanes sp. N902-109]
MVTDFDRELAQVDADLGRLRQASPDDVEAATQLAYRLQHRANLTGARPVEAERAVAQAIERWGPAQDLCLLKATMHLQSHELAAARDAVHAAPGLAATDPGRLLLADIELQRGGDATAEATYGQVEQTWDVLARIAHLHVLRGAPAEAQAWYDVAEDELTAKQMRSYAWLCVQRGEVEEACGHPEAAATHYAKAERGYSGWWSVTAHRAALLPDDQAIAANREIYARFPRPETAEAIGIRYARSGRPLDAGPWLDRALAGYLGPDGLGSPRYHHHLAAFYTSVRPDPAEAVRWARLDWELRPNPRTAKALAAAMDMRRSAHA